MQRLPFIGKSQKKCIAIISSLAVTTAIAAPQHLEGNFSNSSSSVDNSQKEQLQYRVTRLNFAALKNVSDAAHGKTQIQLKLPLPEAGDTEFTLTDSGTFPAELAQRYPHIRSMKGVDAQGRQVRLDMSENGVRAIIFDKDGTWLIQPEKTANSYSTENIDYVTFRAPHQTLQREELIYQQLSSTLASIQNQPAADNGHRDYRIAVATTSAYSKHFGGTVNGSLASVVETINRVNAVFERDLGIHLTLVKDNDKIIFTDPEFDPYIQPPGEKDFSFTRKTNIETLNKIIGKDNFDVGHLFELSTGGGVKNSAACKDDDKADASSGLTPESDDTSLLNNKFISIVIHELGHQFGADHTFNGCMRDSENTAFEPGSGSTIMSYAGECFLSGSGWPPKINILHNLENTKNTYFHAKNIEQVRTFIAGAGSACGVKRNNPNSPPLITSPHSEETLFIPAQTPFSLTGSARSKNPHAQLTYAWEQIDLGPEQMEDKILSDQGVGPIFRSYPPVSSGTRIFPKLETILDEEKTSIGEVYPATTRQLNFRLTVRDNLGDKSSTSYVDRKIHVLDTGQPFAITHPINITKFKYNSKQSVTWNVAGTAQAPISCKNIRIDLSIDGGHTYLPQPLLASTPNTGSTQVSMPTLDQDTSKARIRASCNNNLFFAISPNFTIMK